jgi:hypothetical protein
MGIWPWNGIAIAAIILGILSFLYGFGLPNPGDRVTFSFIGLVVIGVGVFLRKVAIISSIGRGG